MLYRIKCISNQISNLRRFLILKDSKQDASTTSISRFVLKNQKKNLAKLKVWYRFVIFSDLMFYILNLWEVFRGQCRQFTKYHIWYLKVLTLHFCAFLFYLLGQLTGKCPNKCSEFWGFSMSWKTGTATRSRRRPGNAHGISIPQLSSHAATLPPPPLLLSADFPALCSLLIKK